MKEVFSLEDIFNVMIELESMGSVHYSNMKNMTYNSNLIVLFDKLSKQELAHKELYTRFKTETITFSAQKVDDEYKAYMDCLLTQTIGFLNGDREVTDFEKGFAIAVQLEKDTIMFLNELKEIIGSSHAEEIDRIILQEKAHLRALYEYSQKIL
ncbi:ferritin family protein [Pseudobacteroides cellulosolvens]|uniref:Uncharacterized protein n=1 Tax=Pseudobacteroides cellulosolvens ATCC 35603 = DSM 2933 TaxID=398512 RepID=A0A0L6JU75_9FIRM|nr:ferritin family protein [Pseudobacteroides cellulosolvens]KNY28982.1 hypothetical protein Bccel_4256 [Pseudobacteroides cellulosolvens ATCC 35603 = DSM 2933]